MMQLREIVLYSPRGDVRRLTFSLNAVNIVTGGSQTGKSSVIDIVDYCTGRGSCTIAAGVLRERVSWYAVLLQFGTTQVFLARRVPAPEVNTTSDMYMETGVDLEPPPFEALRPTITPDAVVAQLTELAGISPNEHRPPTGQTRLPLRATIEHAKLLVFQSQSEIANRHFLFHRQGDQFMPQAIKDTLPFFLGAVPDEVIGLRERLRILKTERSTLVRQLEERELLIGEGALRARTLASELVEAGVLAEAPAEGAEIEALRQATERTAEVSELQGNEADRLRDLQSELRARYAELREGLAAIRVYTSAESGFEREARVHEARLESVGLLPGPTETNDRCPLCESDLHQHTPSSASFTNALTRLRADLDRVGERKPRLDFEATKISLEMERVRRRLLETRARLGALEAQEADVRLQASLETRRAHVLGRVSLYLETLGDRVGPADSTEQIAALNQEIQRLEEQLGDESMVEATNGALSRMSRWMTEWASALSLEYAGETYRFELNRLTTVADTAPRPTRMDQMGSAENWLGCHLVTHLALHKLLIERDRPVPRFLILDQPTSAFYPPETAGPEIDDEDTVSVRRMYSWIFDKHAAELDGLQIIILDHADLAEERFQAAVRARWRNGAALVPTEWLEPPPDLTEA